MTFSGFTLNNIAIYICFIYHFSSFIGEFKNTEVPYMYAIEVEESTSVECGIAFSPVEVSSVFCYSYHGRVVGLQISYLRIYQISPKFCFEWVLF